MEKTLATTIVYWGCYGDNGKENGDDYRVKSDLSLGVGSAILD